jgi:hypothetical protein
MARCGSLGVSGSRSILAGNRRDGPLKHRSSGSAEASGNNETEFRKSQLDARTKYEPLCQFCVS